MLSQFFAKKIKRHPSNEVDLAFSQCKNARLFFFKHTVIYTVSGLSWFPWSTHLDPWKPREFRRLCLCCLRSRTQPPCHQSVRLLFASWLTQTIPWNETPGKATLEKAGNIHVKSINFVETHHSTDCSHIHAKSKRRPINTQAVETCWLVSKSTNVQIFFLHLDLHHSWFELKFRIHQNLFHCFRETVSAGISSHWIISLDLRPKPVENWASQQTKLLCRLRAIPDSSWQWDRKKSFWWKISRMKTDDLIPPTSRVSWNCCYAPDVVSNYYTNGFSKVHTATTSSPICWQCPSVWTSNSQSRKLPSNGINCVSSLWKYQATKLL